MPDSTAGTIAQSSFFLSGTKLSLKSKSYFLPPAQVHTVVDYFETWLQLLDREPQRCLHVTPNITIERITAGTVVGWCPRSGGCPEIGDEPVEIEHGGYSA